MLERHLRIGDALTEDALVEKTMMEGGVSMVRGDPPLKFTKIVDPVNGKRLLGLYLPTHFFQEGKYHCTADLLFSGSDSITQVNMLLIQHKQNSLFKTSQTGNQLVVQ